MIYFLRSGPDGPVKIGWTRNLEHRLRHLQPGTPDKTEIIRTLECERWAEGWLHKQFAAARRFGEWFEYQPEMLTIQPPEIKPGRRVGARIAPTWAKARIELHVWLDPDTLQRLKEIAALDRREVTGQASHILKEAILAIPTDKAA